MFDSPCYTAQWYKSVTCHECCIWKPACQKQVSRAGISFHIPDTVERNYLSLPLVTASGTQVTLYSATILPQFTVHLAQPMPHLIQGRHQRLWHVSLILSCTKRPLWLLSIYSRYFSITQCCSSRQLVVTKWERNHLITVYSLNVCYNPPTNAPTAIPHKRHCTSQNTAKSWNCVLSAIFGLAIVRTFTHVINKISLCMNFMETKATTNTNLRSWRQGNTNNNNKNTVIVHFCRRVTIGTYTIPMHLLTIWFNRYHRQASFQYQEHFI